MRPIIVLACLALSAAAHCAEYLVIQFPLTADADANISQALKNLGVVEIEVTARGDGTYVDEYKTAILNDLATEGWRVIGLTSYGVGATTIYFER